MESETSPLEKITFPSSEITNPIADFPNCQAGEFSVENEVLVFHTITDFFQTIDFLNCATEQEKAVWRNSFPLMTAQKYFLAFKNAFECCDSLSNQELDNLVEQFEGKIKVHSSPEGYNIYEPLYMLDPEFRNIDGAFMVGDQIEVETEEYKISILDGDWTKVPIAINTGQTNIDAKIIVDWNNGGGQCCPVTAAESIVTGDKKLFSQYRWRNNSQYRFVSGEGYYYIPRIAVSITQNSEKRGLFRPWDCYKRSFDINMKFNWVGPGISPISKSHIFTTHVECSHNLTYYEQFSSWVGPFDYMPTTCLKTLRMVVNVQNPNQQSDIECIATY